jgi:aspartate aminotransferase
LIISGHFLEENGQKNEGGNDGIPVVIVGTKEQGYKITAKQLEDAITPLTKAFVLNTPSNPTGMIYTKEELQAIADVIIKKDIYVIADEMYEFLIYGEEEHISIASLNDEIYKRTITCSGLSKSYAMTGWRIGYTGSSVEIAKLMDSIQSHATSNPNSIAQKAAVEALEGPSDAIEIMKEEFNKRRLYMFHRINNMPYFSTLEPRGAFYVFIDTTDVLEKEYKGQKIGNTERLTEILLTDFMVAVVPCGDFGFANHIRLSYAISMEMIEKGLDRIESFLKAL